jgi:5S rRNA maturation endonuclease (ribonuclease M5)
MSGLDTLEDALANGQGVERPFRCTAHEDSHASASVNVIKQVWYCYACGANGRLDGKAIAPSDDALLAMLAPDRIARVYHQCWLDLFTTVPGYWLTRFPRWLCTALELGTDPYNDLPCYPVRSSEGQINGVALRNEEGVEPKYRYPYGAATSRTMFMLANARDAVVVLVEGMADAAALIEVGIDARATYGAGLHAPQVQMLLSSGPRVVLLGYDADKAGQRAAAASERLLSDHLDVAVIDWAEIGVKDPSEAPPVDRLWLASQTVGASAYGEHQRQVMNDWQQRATALQKAGLIYE